MVFISNFPRKYFYFPEGYVLPEGTFPLGSLSGQKHLVDEAAIQPYEISYQEAQKHLYQDLNGSIHRFLNAVKSKTGQPFDPTETEKDFLAPEHLFAKAKEGASLLGNMGAAIRIMWETAKTDDEATAVESRKKMKAIREKLSAKGILLKEDFDEIPLKLREKHSGKGAGFQESAAAFEKEWTEIKTKWTSIFNSKKTEK